MVAGDIPLKNIKSVKSIWSGITPIVYSVLGMSLLAVNTLLLVSITLPLVLSLGSEVGLYRRVYCVISTFLPAQGTVPHMMEIEVGEVEVTVRPSGGEVGAVYIYIIGK